MLSFCLRFCALETASPEAEWLLARFTERESCPSTPSSPVSGRFSLGALASRRRPVFWSASRRDAGGPSRSSSRASTHIYSEGDLQAKRSGSQVPQSPDAKTGFRNADTAPATSDNEVQASSSLDAITA